MKVFKLKSIQEINLDEQKALVAGSSNHSCECTCNCPTEKTTQAKMNANGNTTNLETKLL